MKPVYIYGLYDPRFPDVIRYVGKTINCASRMVAHKRSALVRNVDSHCYRWLRSLYKDGIQFQYKIIKLTNELEWQSAEIDAIACLLAMGFDLTNTSVGGNGMNTIDCEKKEQIKNKISTALKGRKPSEETRARLSNSHTGRIHLEETRLKMAESHRVRHPSIDNTKKAPKAKNHGENHGMAKINASDVIAIRASNKTCSQLALEFSISRSHVTSIQRRKKWAHI